MRWYHNLYIANTIAGLVFPRLIFAVGVSQPDRRRRRTVPDSVYCFSVVFYARFMRIAAFSVGEWHFWSGIEGDLTIPKGLLPVRLALAERVTQKAPDAAYDRTDAS
jgi:hypothetical protein